MPGVPPYQPPQPITNVLASKIIEVVQKPLPSGRALPMSVQLAPPSSERNSFCDCSWLPASSSMRAGSLKLTLTESECVTEPTCSNDAPLSVVLYTPPPL